ncbi:MAG: SPOR domain-containing protein [Acidobacteriia bacterium]|nr:SPOR domain-containing protein [Terriglobia bacterium]
MRNNETGEFELVVGNRQLLSGFFIGVVLLAVVFAMGYVVGQSSPRTAKLAVEAAAGAPAAVAETRPKPASPAAPPPVAAAPQPPVETAAPADEKPQPSTQPARDAQETPPAAAAPAAAASALVPQAELPAGSFWQLSAVRPPAAEVMRQTLRDKGFPVLLSPAPNNLVRVLVGPYTDTATMGRAKMDLEKAGFPTPIKK